MASPVFFWKPQAQRLVLICTLSVLATLLMFGALESALARNVVARDLARFGVSSRRLQINPAWLAKSQAHISGSVRTRYLIGTYLLWIDDPLRAQAALEAGSGPDADPLAGWALTEALAAQGSMDEAAEVLAQVGIPTDQLVRWGEANWSLLDKGGSDDRRADLYFSAADAQGGGSWAAQRSLGRWWLFRYNNSQEALAYLLSAHAFNPGDAYTDFLIAESYRRLGDINQAIEYMERSDQLYGDRMPYRPGLAQMYLERNQPGDVVRARDALEPFLQRNPNHERALWLMEQIQKRLP